MRPEMTTDRLLLRWVDMDDLGRIEALANNWNVARMLARVAWPYPGAADWIATLGPAREAGNGAAYAIIAPDEGLTGVVGLDRRENGTFELGYWLGEPYWGRGYATEAAQAAVDIAFEDLGVREITSGHFEENAASGRVLAKCGFRYSGRSMRPCLARGHEMPSIDVLLTRGDWETTTGRAAKAH